MNYEYSRLRSSNYYLSANKHSFKKTNFTNIATAKNELIFFF